MHTSRNQVRLAPELLSYLGSLITNRRLLYDLCLTSKSFNSVFSPFLYEEVCFTVENEHVLINHLKVLLGSPSLEYVRKLDLSINDRVIPYTAHARQPLCQLYNEAVQVLILK